MKYFLLFLISFSAFSAVFPERDSKGRIIQRSAGINADNVSRVRFIGTHDFNIAGNATVSSDWTVPQMQYSGSNVDTVIQGVQFKVIGGCDGDKVKFQVVHPQAGVLDEFATDFYIFKDETNIIKEQRASLPAGLLVRVVYQSTCGTSARFIMNLLRYIETE